MSSSRVIRLFDKHEIPKRRVLPCAIALDEFKEMQGANASKRSLWM
ncbi:hypothetical protein [Alteribacter populi]|nr:hypothetical protein [Alteribacter populi]